MREVGAEVENKNATEDRQSYSLWKDGKFILEEKQQQQQTAQISHSGNEKA